MPDKVTLAPFFVEFDETHLEADLGACADEAQETVDDFLVLLTLARKEKLITDVWYKHLLVRLASLSAHLTLSVRELKTEMFARENGPYYQ